MKHVFTLLAFALMSTGLAQVPDYIPESGLIGWYPLDGSLESSIDPTQDGFLNGPVITEDRFGNPNGALSFDGVDDFGTINHYSAFENCAEMTISVWVNPATYPSNVVYCGGGTGASYLFLRKWSSTNESRTFEMALTNWAVGSTGPLADGYLGFCNNGGCWGPGEMNGVGSWSDVPVNSWTHLAYVIGSDSSWVYVNGEVLYADTEGAAPNGLTTSNNPIYLGRAIGSFAQCQSVLNGKLDDIGFWNRALTEEEILSLYLAEEQISGCTDPLACNFDPLATIDDGGCLGAPIELGENIESCEDSVFLDAGSGFTQYQWNTGETSQSIVVTEPGTYSVNAANSLPNDYALYFDGENSTAQPINSILFGTASFSISIDCRLDAFEGSDAEPYSYIVGHPLTEGTQDHGFKIQTASDAYNGGFMVHINDEGTTHFNVISFDNSSQTNVELDQWYDLTMVVDRDNALFSFYVDGVLVEAQSIHPDFGNVDHPNGFDFGVQSIHGSALLAGAIDNFQVWNIALTPEQVADLQIVAPTGAEDGLIGFWDFEEGEGHISSDLYGNAPAIQLDQVTWTGDTPAPLLNLTCSQDDSIEVTWLPLGCTDLNACNYDEAAMCDDGTCATCEQLQTACGPGTTWDLETQQCIEANTSSPCGEGTVWDDVNQECVVFLPSDTDFDGCVGMIDLLDLLSVFGTCVEVPWACGDPLEYQGSDYETVQIGEQCWFAENLRAEQYRDGSTISKAETLDEWFAGYGVQCSYSFDEEISVERGLLYNGVAVNDERKLCPSGWHVPTDEEFMILEDFLGMPEGDIQSVSWRGTNEGAKLRTSSLLFDGYIGTDEVGFNGVPAGTLFADFGSLNYSLHLWTSTSTSQFYNVYRAVDASPGGIYRSSHIVSYGHSIRCLQDSE